MRLTRPCFMGLQFPSCTAFELIEVFIPDQLHQELTAEKIMVLKMATQQEQGNGDDLARGLLRQERKSLQE